MKYNTSLLSDYPSFSIDRHHLSLFLKAPFENYENVSSLFVWNDTKQGHSWWSLVHEGDPTMIDLAVGLLKEVVGDTLVSEEDIWE